MLFRRINFKKFTDGRGDLIPLEFGSDFDNADIPFDVKRCYFISGPTNDGIRGQHAHRNLEQVIIAANGSFTLVLDDGEAEKEEIKLDSNTVGIHIKNLVWRELKDFSHDCVILVLASEHYKESDYIRNKDEFYNCVKNNEY